MPLSYFDQGSIVSDQTAVSTVDLSTLVTEIQDKTSSSYFDATAKIGRVDVFYLHEDNRQRRRLIHDSTSNFEAIASWSDFARDGTWAKDEVKTFALKTHEIFKNNVPELYNRVYKGTDNLSYCYDPLTILASKHPGLFTFEKFGKHRIGTALEADKAKEKLLDTIKKGLS